MAHMVVAGFMATSTGCGSAEPAAPGRPPPTPTAPAPPLLEVVNSGTPGSTHPAVDEPVSLGDELAAQLAPACVGMDLDLHAFNAALCPADQVHDVDLPVDALDFEVSPNPVVVKPGGEATFEVSIVNRSDETVAIRADTISCVSLGDHGKVDRDTTLWIRQATLEDAHGRPAGTQMGACKYRIGGCGGPAVLIALPPGGRARTHDQAYGWVVRMNPQCDWAAPVPLKPGDYIYRISSPVFRGPPLVVPVQVR